MLETCGQNMLSAAALLDVNKPNFVRVPPEMAVYMQGSLTYLRSLFLFLLQIQMI